MIVSSGQIGEHSGDLTGSNALTNDESLPFRMISLCLRPPPPPPLMCPLRWNDSEISLVELVVTRMLREFVMVVALRHCPLGETDPTQSKRCVRSVGRKG